MCFNGETLLKYRIQVVSNKCQMLSIDLNAHSCQRLDITSRYLDISEQRRRRVKSLKSDKQLKLVLD